MGAGRSLRRNDGPAASNHRDDWLRLLGAPHCHFYCASSPGIVPHVQGISFDRIGADDQACHVIGILGLHIGLAFHVNIAVPFV